jgi:hypothetical protein
VSAHHYWRTHDVISYLDSEKFEAAARGTSWGGDSGWGFCYSFENNTGTALGLNILNTSRQPAAAVYSARCISDRFLPDKAIDLVDEAASALRLAQESKPDESESLEREIMTLQIELESLKNESDTFSVERKNKVEQELNEKREDAAALAGVWQTGEWTEIRTGLGLTRVLCRGSSAGQDQRRQA